MESDFSFNNASDPTQVSAQKIHQLNLESTKAIANIETNLVRETARNLETKSTTYLETKT